jgi:hypothetical protein
MGGGGSRTTGGNQLCVIDRVELFSGFIFYILNRGALLVRLPSALKLQSQGHHVPPSFPHGHFCKEGYREPQVHAHPLQ